MGSYVFMETQVDGLKDISSFKPLICKAFSGAFGEGEYKLRNQATPFISVIKDHLNKRQGPNLDKHYFICYIYCVSCVIDILVSFLLTKVNQE